MGGCRAAANRSSMARSETPVAGLRLVAIEYVAAAMRGRPVGQGVRTRRRSVRLVSGRSRSYMASGRFKDGLHDGKMRRPDALRRGQ